MLFEIFFFGNTLSVDSSSMGVDDIGVLLSEKIGFLETQLL